MVLKRPDLPEHMAKVAPEVSTPESHKPLFDFVVWLTGTVYAGSGPSTLTTDSPVPARTTTMLAGWFEGLLSQ